MMVYLIANKNWLYLNPPLDSPVREVYFKCKASIWTITLPWISISTRYPGDLLPSDLHITRNPLHSSSHTLPTFIPPHPWRHIRVSGDIDIYSTTFLTSHKGYWWYWHLFHYIPDVTLGLVVTLTYSIIPLQNWKRKRSWTRTLTRVSSILCWLLQIKFHYSIFSIQFLFPTFRYPASLLKNKTVAHGRGEKMFS